MRIAAFIIILISITANSFGQTRYMSQSLAQIAFALPIAGLPFFLKRSNLLPSATSSIVFTAVYLFLLGLSLVLYFQYGEVNTTIGVMTLSLYGITIAAMASTDDKGDTVKYISISVIMVFILIVSSSIILSPVKIYRYVGIFSNPNQMGRFSASTIALSAPLAFLYFRINSPGFLLSGVVSLVAIIMVIITNSRSSLLSTILSFGCIGYVLLMTGSLRQVLGVVSFALAGLCLVALAFHLGLLEHVLAKFVATSSRGDLYQGRLSGWSEILETWTWFGHGAAYVPLSIGSSHNLFLGLLGRFGALVAGLVYLPFLVGFVRTSYVALAHGHTFDRTGQFLAGTALSGIAAFLAINTFEGSTATILSLVGFVGIGCWLQLEASVPRPALLASDHPASHQT